MNESSVEETIEEPYYPISEDEWETSPKEADEVVNDEFRQKRRSKTKIATSTVDEKQEKIANTDLNEAKLNEDDALIKEFTTSKILHFRRAQVCFDLLKSKKKNPDNSELVLDEESSEVDNKIEDDDNSETEDFE
ncbi:hypothetical protein ILUMI_15997 [Ignelater luminosus]|uniref:Uncharacterized protein n=1 Tax=Ignelater luminosus TaxID=2038154 RepID=A0A8K0G8Z5_IGNLU|nr:hypothetical protein ILUMI_15997 [Ignelater luminosus]